jgi:acetoin utilization deacetylase AcuC-like enzyme
MAEELQDITQSLAPYFALQEGGYTYDALVQCIAAEVQYLIDYDLNKLWNVLYRIDVSEKKVKEVIETTPFTQHSLLIAQLILKRQQEKIISRKQYKPDM